MRGEFSSRSFVHMLRWLQEGLSGGMTQNTSSSVTHIRSRRKEEPKMNKKTVDDRLQCKDEIFSSVSKFTLRLSLSLRSRISFFHDKGMLPYWWVARSETSKNLLDAESKGTGSITVGQAQSLS